MPETVQVTRAGFLEFLRLQEFELEAANEHALAATVREWADALERGDVPAPSPGLHGHVGMTGGELAFLVLEVMAAMEVGEVLTAVVPTGGDLDAALAAATHEMTGDPGKGLYAGNVGHADGCPAGAWNRSPGGGRASKARGEPVACTCSEVILSIQRLT